MHVQIRNKSSSSPCSFSYLLPILKKQANNYYVSSFPHQFSCAADGWPIILKVSMTMINFKIYQKEEGNESVRFFYKFFRSNNQGHG